MILIKYRMLNNDGSWVETLNLQQAEQHGNYIIVEEEVVENIEQSEFWYKDNFNGGIV